MLEITGSVFEIRFSVFLQRKTGQLGFWVYGFYLCNISGIFQLKKPQNKGLKTAKTGLFLVEIL